MNKVIRYMVADYLNTSAANTPSYALMGTGYTTLDEHPAAKVDKTAYVSDKAVSGTITGYENTFPFNTQFISDDGTVAFIYDIARNQKTGAEAETDYVRVDLFGEATGGAYPARKFRVAVEVTQITGAGTEVMVVAGNLHQVGDFVDGTFNPTNREFTPAA